MSPAHVFEPTYKALRHYVISGAWPPGYRLEGGILADKLGVSVTPVRDAMNYLAGEGLLEMLPGMGFRIPRCDFHRLQGHMEMNCLLLCHCLTRQKAAQPALSPPTPAPYAERIADAFLSIAYHSDNPALVEAIGRLNAVLHPLRLQEPRLFDTEGDLMSLERAAFATEPDLQERISTIQDYHQSRINNLSLLMQSLSKVQT